MDEIETKCVIFTVNKPLNNQNQLKEKKEKKEKNKKRVEAERWTFSTDNYLYENQLKIIKNIHINNYNCDYTNEISKITFQQINRKIYGYKQQDIIKNMLITDKFIDIKSIIHKMLDCELKCYYCLTEMYVLYDISREAKQWTVDRINNNIGHTIDNYYLACLECNLKRRRRSDEKYLFTKQLKLVKIV